MICLVSLTSRPQKGLAIYLWEKGRALLTSLFEESLVFCLFYLAKPGQSPLPNSGSFGGLVVEQRLGVRNITKSCFWRCSFYLARSSQFPLPNLGSVAGQSSICWRKGRALETLFGEVFGVLPFLFGRVRFHCPSWGPSLDGCLYVGEKAEHFGTLLGEVWSVLPFLFWLLSWPPLSANGHITLNTPVLVRSLKYLDGWPLGNTGCCWHSFFSFFPSLTEWILLFFQIQPT